jgi:signal peptidase I
MKGYSRVPDPFDPTTAAPPSIPAGPPPSTPDTVKETFESVVIAFILAFVFRAYVVEAFVIPTGSMAPTLLGEHVRVTCQQCGYTFDFDPLDDDRRENRGGETRPYITHGGPSGHAPSLAARCPMCNFPNPVPYGTRISAGDRILVLKYIYNFSEPRRWDVVVFKAPHDPDINFIKRLVGLPNEELQIIEGNIYTRPVDSVGQPIPGKDWRIARKTDRPAVQRAVWQPIYHSDYIPLDRGQVVPGRLLDPRQDNPWEVPWKVAAGEPRDWFLGTPTKPVRTYRYDAVQRGSISFNMDRRSSSPILYPYDQAKMSSNATFEVEPVEDVRIAAGFEPQADKLQVTLQTTARWGEADDNVRVTLAGRIDEQGQATLTIAKPGAVPTIFPGQTKQVGPFTSGQTRRVELWYVDQELSLWVDGQRVLREAFELPIERLRNRPPLDTSSVPDIRIDVQGSPVSLHNVEVDRDLFYSSANSENAPPGLGGLVKHKGLSPRGQPAHLSADQFFCMGDNSPLSSDGRYWDGVNPWVRERDFSHDPSVQVLGIVPRKLMMGRAFFVYWPAMYSTPGGGWTLIPNFGDLRFIH